MIDGVHRAEAQAHVTLADGRELWLAAALVRFPGGAQLLRASLTEHARCTTLVIGEPRVAAVLARAPSARHPLVRRALAEVLAGDHLPYPDVTAELADEMVVHAAGDVTLKLAIGAVSIALAIAPAHAPIGTWIPRCAVTGTVDGIPIARGTATYFEGADIDRILVTLDDGTLLHATGARAILVRDGVHHVAATLSPRATWTSLYTFHEYAVAWRLEAADLDLEIRARLDDQELVTVTAGDPLWQGACAVTGTAGGRPVRGVAYLAQTARDAAASLPEFFAAIPRETLRVIQHQLPLPLRFEQVLAMLGTDLTRYVRDVDVGEVARILIAPIREILDRKGKAWRSYTAVVCYYALRGDRWRQDVIDVLLGLAEVIHVGSLIVDDVEDASPTRRGGPACHVAHGLPIAINAGTFCYFIWQAWFARLDLPPSAKLQIYEIYFAFMRMGHLGQALDIQGFTHGMADQIVETGDVAALARQMQNVYLLKTGAPASVFAQIGAIVAGGREAQVRAVGDLFEALGIAFQIMDDVQNLKGFQGDPKHCEDLAQAKITMPVLEAMRVLDRAARGALWNRIVRCASEPALVPEIVDALERCGAFAACRDQAHRLLEDAWRAAAPHLEDSIAKVMLRSFCLYVVECLG